MPALKQKATRPARPATSARVLPFPRLNGHPAPAKGSKRPGYRIDDQIGFLPAPVNTMVWWDSDFDEPDFQFQPPGFGGVSYLKTPEDPETGEEVGLQNFTVFTNGGSRPDPSSRQEWYQGMTGDPNFVVFDDTDQLALAKECLAALDISDEEYKPRVVLSAISRAKDTDSISPSDRAPPVRLYASIDLVEVETELVREHLGREPIHRGNGLARAKPWRGVAVDLRREDAAGQGCDADANYGHSAEPSDDGKRVFVSYWDSGFVALDVTNPANPILEGHTVYGTDEDGDGHSSNYDEGRKVLFSAAIREFVTPWAPRALASPAMREARYLSSKARRFIELCQLVRMSVRFRVGLVLEREGRGKEPSVV